MSGASAKVDVAIVGAGAAGAIMAAYLAEAGFSVVIFEAGPDWKAKDMISSHIWSRRLRWGGPAVETGGENPIGFGFNAGWGTGGAALHHYGTWPRMKPADFSVKADHDRWIDWPIGYDDIREHYDHIQKEVGLSGDAKVEIWRPEGDPYPMPALPKLPQGELLESAFEKSGLRTAPSPMAINSVEYNGRPACIYDGWCDAGCPTMALANPLAIYLPRAKKAGAKLRTETPVLKILSTKAGEVDGVEYRNGNGDVARQMADMVVLTGSVVGNPALMLNSANEVNPDGVGNQNDQVGRNVMTHALVQILGLFAQETSPHRGVTGAHLISHEHYGKTSTSGAFGSRQWLIAPSIKPNDVAGLAAARMDLNGEKLGKFIQQAVRHGANMVGMCEEAPNPENRVMLGSQKNSWGNYSAKIEHKFSADAKKLWEAMRDEGMAIFKKGGASDVWHTPMNSAHLMGGTIMGVDPKTSVTDDVGRVHGQSNLYIAGTGLFPTSGAVNPTFTLHALALRTVKKLIAQRATRSLSEAA